MGVEDVELVELEPQEAAIVPGRVRTEDLPAFLGTAFGEVVRVLAEQHLGPAGPPFGRYTPVEAGFDVEAGFPATGSVTHSGRVVALALPGGRAARIRYRGDYAGIGEAYDAVHAWLAARDLAATGQPWESYLDGPEVAEPRTLVYVPCAPR
ncbi:MAG TPA: GyrI-like domain-containing protein [Kineosporiaceae bacterium]|nr:GyrI-like domain-containing protein [Kineosporiaceae bacterium]